MSRLSTACSSSFEPRRAFRPTTSLLDTIGTMADRVRHVVQSAFDGRRIVIFSGGATKGADAVYDDARAINEGGGFGSIIGRNAFQRPKADAIKMLRKIMNIYLGKE